MRRVSWFVVLALLIGPVLADDLPQGLLPLKLDKKSKTADAAKTRELQSSARLTSFSTWVTSVTFSPDDKSLAVGLENAVQLIDVDSKSPRTELALPKSGHVKALAYSPDGRLLATGAYQRVALWDPSTSKSVLELKGHRGQVTAVAFSPDGGRLATACEDEAVRIWTLNTDHSLKDAVPTVMKVKGQPVMSVAWSPDGSMIAAAAGDETRRTKPGKVIVWNSVTGEEKHAFELHGRAATGVAFSTDGKILASTSMDEHVNLYDLTTNKAIGYFGGHSRPTNAVLFHPDGETVISVSGGSAVGKNELKVWEFQPAEELATVEAHQARITCLALSHDGRVLATGSVDRTVALWNVGFLAVGLPAASSPKSRPELTGAAVSSTIITPPADALLAVAVGQAGDVKEQPKLLRAGIIGLDTSHAIAFTKTLNAEKPNRAVAGCRIVAAYPKGSPDIESSVSQVPGYTEEIKKMDVQIVDSIDDLLKQVDVVMLETNDGRPHFEQVLPVLKAGKPCFIDKPIAGTLADAVAIFEAAKKYKTPVFSSSSLRFGKNSLAVREGSLGRVKSCVTSSPASLEPTHPDLFWYGIHGVESLFTVMGTGCESVVRGKTEGQIEVVGQWSGGRTGTFREGKGYAGKAVGEKGEADVGSYDGYDPLVFEIVKFFRTGQPPVSEQETLEIYAFMEAADESKRQNGSSVTLESVLTKAREEAKKKVADLK